jgi:hypothetical protein
VLLYLCRHGQHVNSMTMKSTKDDYFYEYLALDRLPSQDREEKAATLARLAERQALLPTTVTLRQLPHNQLTKLQLESVKLQLDPGQGFEGVLGAAAKLAALKQLQLKNCSPLADQPTC